MAALTAGGITAPFVIDRAMNAQIFKTYVDKVLVPVLKPGDIVVMDNLSSHKRPEIATAIKAAGASVFYLPAYSPDLNPIEQAFAKLKALLRSTGARTLPALWKTIGQALQRFSIEECRAYIQNAGYHFRSA